jgi:glycosyltransferase involved in cell wall biosynthesis
MKITILTFNHGVAGKYANGPGMCLVNFVKILKKAHSVSVFSHLPSNDKSVKPLSNFREVRKHLDKSDLVIHWSGLDKSFASYCKYAKSRGAKVLVGPNVIDGVELKKEQEYLAERNFHKILTVNQRLRFLISKVHKLPPARVDILMVGPDLELWEPVREINQEILWKGNSKHFVKDVKFGLEVSKKLKGKYKFHFIGHPKPYDYLEHIPRAKMARVYMCTSLSETMGLALAEQWAAGIPSVTHPKVYLHGENYKTGIITNRTVDDYCEAIEELMENDRLFQRTSKGAYDYAHKLFAPEVTLSEFHRIWNSLERLV